MLGPSARSYVGKWLKGLSPITWLESGFLPLLMDFKGWGRGTIEEEKGKKGKPRVGEGVKWDLGGI